MATIASTKQTWVTIEGIGKRMFRGELCAAAWKGYNEIKSNVLTIRPDPEYELQRATDKANAYLKVLQDTELATPIDHAEAAGYMAAYYKATPENLFKVFDGLEKMEDEMHAIHNAGKAGGEDDTENKKGN